MRLSDGSAPQEPKEGETIDPGIILVETLPTHLQSPDPRSPGSEIDIPSAGNMALQLQIQAKLPK